MLFTCTYTRGIISSAQVISNSSVTPWTTAHQAPLSMGFPRLAYWSGLPFPSPGAPPDPGLNLRLLHWQAGSLSLSHQGSPKGAQKTVKDVRHQWDSKTLSSGGRILQIKRVASYVWLICAFFLSEEETNITLTTLCFFKIILLFIQLFIVLLELPH